MMIQYIGKCLLIEEGQREKKKEKVLVAGDIHLGFGGGKIGGIDIDKQLFDSVIVDFEKIFKKIGRADKIMLLGDLKHGFSGLGEGERYGLVNLFDYLDKKCGKIIAIKGNHDNYLMNITKRRGIRVCDFYIWNNYAFVHGDRDFPILYKNEVKVWVMGHLHPIISLKDGAKQENYKCFLEGGYRNKKIIILPSFIDVGGGFDIRNANIENNLAWNFHLDRFIIKIVGEDDKVLDFGKLGNLL